MEIDIPLIAYQGINIYPLIKFILHDKITDDYNITMYISIQACMCMPHTCTSTQAHVCAHVCMCCSLCPVALDLTLTAEICMKVLIYLQVLTVLIYLQVLTVLIYLQVLTVLIYLQVLKVLIYLQVLKVFTDMVNTLLGNSAKTFDFKYHFIKIAMK